jgi:hypothetical protein
MTTDKLVEACCACPFLEKEEWSNDDDSGVDYVDCDLGMPQPHHESRKALYSATPPEWCKLREGPVLVKLRTA